MKCSFDPKTLLGQPIGMFHCPECGELILAGYEHPNYDLIDDMVKENQEMGLYDAKDNPMIKKNN